LVALIDDLRTEMQARLDEILVEAEKLRKAIAALETADVAAPARRKGARSAAAVATRPERAARGRSTAAPSRARPALGELRSTERTRATRTRATKPATSRRSGGTKEAVLAALVKGDSMTASKVAASTGLGRASVSTTLSKLTKTDEVVKADRGYKLPASRSNGRS
jgi:DNA-binding transcriptional ArsR family regulator